MKVTLGVKRKASGHGTKRCLVEKVESFVYVPILETLQVLLNDEGIMAEASEHK